MKKGRRRKKKKQYTKKKGKGRKGIKTVGRKRKIKKNKATRALKCKPSVLVS